MSIKIEFRVSETDKKTIKEKSQNAGLTISEYCRRSALNKKTTQIFTHQQEELYKNLTKYHSNFSRLTNIIRNKDSQFYKELGDLVRFFKAEIQNFSNDR